MQGKQKRKQELLIFPLKCKFLFQTSLGLNFFEVRHRTDGICKVVLVAVWCQIASAIMLPYILPKEVAVSHLWEVQKLSGHTPMQFALDIPTWAEVSTRWPPVSSASYEKSEMINI